MQQTDDLIGQIYDSALDTTRGLQVLDLICKVMEGTKAVIGDLVLSQAFGGQTIVSQGSSLSSVGLDQSAFSAYMLHYSKLDPLLPIALTSKAGEVTTVESVGKRAELEGSEFFSDYARPLGLLDNAYVPLLSSPETLWFLSVGRPPCVRAYTEDDRRKLSAIAMHMQRALQIKLRLAAAEAERESTVSAIPHETLLVNSSSCVVYADPSSSHRLACGDGLYTIAPSNQLYTRSEKETGALRRLVSQAADPWRYASPGGYMRITRPALKPPLTIFVAPMQRASVWPGASNASAMVFISDPERSPCPPRDVLQQLYGLTPAEARVANLLLENLTLQEISDKLGVAVGTVRNQVKHVFAKTDTHRQSELMRVLLHLPQIFLTPSH